MEQCVFLIQEDACLATILLEEMRIKVHVHIHAAGNMRLSKKQDRESICRYMKMSVGHIFSIQKIFA